MGHCDAKKLSIPESLWNILSHSPPKPTQRTSPP